MNLYEATEQAREALTAAGIRPTNPKIIAVAYQLVNGRVEGRPASGWIRYLQGEGRI